MEDKMVADAVAPTDEYTEGFAAAIAASGVAGNADRVRIMLEVRVHALHMLISLWRWHMSAHPSCTCCSV